MFQLYNNERSDIHLISRFSSTKWPSAVPVPQMQLNRLSSTYFHAYNSIEKLAARVAGLGGLGKLDLLERPANLAGVTGANVK